MKKKIDEEGGTCDNTMHILLGKGHQIRGVLKKHKYMDRQMEAERKREWKSKREKRKSLPGKKMKFSGYDHHHF